MWQDWLIAVVQAFFCLNLLPAIKANSGKNTPLFTSASTAVGMMLIAIAVGSIPLYFSAITSVIVGIEWAVLACQRLKMPRTS